MTIQHLYPTTRPSLDLNFARTKRLDPRVTFTRGSTATYVGSDGLIKTAASNEARFDLDPATGESLGLLVEEAKTNTIYYSNLDNWISEPTKTLETGLTGPFSQSYLFTTTYTGGEAGRIYSTSGYGSATSGDIVSVYVKLKTNLGGNPSVMLRNGTSGSNAYFNLNTLATGVSGSDWQNPNYIYVGNGWYRFYAKWIGVTTTGMRIYIGSNGSPNSAPIGTAFYIAGLQAETSSYPTSYIPTTSATVTRSADVASMTGTGFSSWWNASTGTFQANFRVKLSGTRPVLSVDDNTANNRIELYTSTSSQKFTVTTSGAAQADITAGTASSTAINSQSAVYGNNDFSTSLNGAAAVTDTSGTVPVVTQLRIGANQAGNTTAAPIARLTYYPTRLTNAQLQALTL